VSRSAAAPRRSRLRLVQTHPGVGADPSRPADWGHAREAEELEAGRIPNPGLVLPVAARTRRRWAAEQEAPRALPPARGGPAEAALPGRGPHTTSKTCSWAGFGRRNGRKQSCENSGPRALPRTRAGASSWQHSLPAPRSPSDPSRPARAPLFQPDRAGRRGDPVARRPSKRPRFSRAGASGA